MKTGEMVMVTWSDGSVDCGELLEHREFPAWASIRTGRGGEMNGMVESVKYLPAEVDVPFGGVNMTTDNSFDEDLDQTILAAGINSTGVLVDVSQLPVLPDPENRFTSQPFMFGYLDALKWFVLRDYSYLTKAGETSTVQCSFVFNFADIPWLIRLKYPVAGDGRNHYGIASMWHDWLLDNGTIGGRKITRSEADDMFLEIMQYLKVDSHTAWIMYKAVQLNTWQRELRGVPFHPEKLQGSNAT